MASKDHKDRSGTFGRARLQPSRRTMSKASPGSAGVSPYRRIYDFRIVDCDNDHWVFGSDGVAALERVHEIERDERGHPPNVG